MECLGRHRRYRESPGTMEGNGSDIRIRRECPRVTVRVIVADLSDNKWFGTDAGVYKYDGRVFTRSETEIYR